VRAKATVEIINERGLHARASAKFVKLAGAFQSRVQVTREDQTVDALSIMGLMMLAAGPGSKIILHVKGADAAAAIADLESLVQRKFDED
jgi:phosphocarrier protein